MQHCTFLFFFFFNDTATTEIYTLPLHDALPIFLSLKWLSSPATARHGVLAGEIGMALAIGGTLLHHGIVDYKWIAIARSEEHTSELQSPCKLAFPLLLAKKKKFAIRLCLDIPAL